MACLSAKNRQRSPSGIASSCSMMRSACAPYGLRTPPNSSLQISVSLNKPLSTYATLAKSRNDCDQGFAQKALNPPTAVAVKNNQTPQGFSLWYFNLNLVTTDSH